MGQKRFINERKSGWSEGIQPALHIMNKVSGRWTNPEDVIRLQKLTEKISLFKSYQEQIEDIAQKPENTPAKLLFTKEASPKADLMIANISHMIKLEKKLETENFKSKAVSVQQLKDRVLLLGHMADFESSLGFGIADIRAYLLTGETKFKLKYQQHWIRKTIAFQEIAALKHLMSKEQKLSMRIIQASRKSFGDVVNKVLELRGNKEWNQANYLLATKAVPLASEIKASLKVMHRNQQKLRDNDFSKSIAQINFLTNTEWLLFAVGLTLSIALAIFVTRSVTIPINNMLYVTNKIADGELSVDINVKGTKEIEQVRSALERMVLQIKERMDERTIELSISEEKSRAIIDNSIDAIITIDPFGVIQSFNPAGERMFGYTAPEVMGRNIKMLMPNEYSREHDGYLAHFRDTGEKRVIGGAREVEAQRKDGTTFPIRLGVTEVFLESGNMFVGVVTDITEERKILEDLSTSEEKSLAIINNSIDSIITINTAGLIQSFNPAGEKMFGYKAKELIGKNIKVLMPEPYHSEHDGYLDTYMDTGERHVIGGAREVQAKRKDGSTFPIRLGVSEVNLASGKLFVGVVTDISREIEHLAEIKRKSHEAETEKTKALIEREKAEAASRSKSEFLANMSHELRTPLNSLLILARMLMKNEPGNLTQQQQDDARIIHESGNDLLTLINDILDLAKIESNKMEANVDQVVLRNIVAKVNEKFSHMAKERGLELFIELDESLPEEIQSDILRIEQILRNFISNALKFTHHGSISVHIFQPDKNTAFSDNSIEADDMVAFSVTDTGIGISQDKHQHIFGAFLQADGSTTRKYGGTGLGLSISLQMAKLLGGEISLKSTEGKGSTFTLYIKKNLSVQPGKTSKFPDAGLTTVQDSKPEGLVAKQVTHAPADPFRDDRGSLATNDSSVLIVEDDRYFFDIVAKKIRARECKCLGTSNAKDVLQLITQYQPNVLILDVNLPNGNGVDIYEELRSIPEYRSLPVLFITIDDDLPHLSDVQPVGVLSKPVGEAELDEALTSLIGPAQSIRNDVLLLECGTEYKNAIIHELDKHDLNVLEAKSSDDVVNIIKTRKIGHLIANYLTLQQNMAPFLQQIKDSKALPLSNIIICSHEDLSSEHGDLLNQYEVQILSLDEDKNAGAETLIAALTRNNMPAQDVNSIPESVSYNFSGIKILIADDEPRNIFSLSRLLASCNVEIYTASNGLEALGVLKENPDVSCILMDMMMPEMNGYQAIEEIRRQEALSNTPIIAITAKAMSGDKEKCLQAGASAYITKPVDETILLSTMSDLITKLAA